MLTAHGYDSQIIAAAMRNGRQIADAALAGAHCVTAGFAVYRDSFRHPYTTTGEEIFRAAWDATPADVATNGRPATGGAEAAPQRPCA